MELHIWDGWSSPGLSLHGQGTAPTPMLELSGHRER